jgi:hypothetical protein
MFDHNTSAASDADDHSLEPGSYTVTFNDSTGALRTETLNSADMADVIAAEVGGHGGPFTVTECGDLADGEVAKWAYKYDRPDGSTVVGNVTVSPAGAAVAPADVEIDDTPAEDLVA